MALDMRNPYAAYINRQKIDEHLNYENAGSVISHCNKYADEAKKSSRAVIKYLFMLGCIALKNKSTATMQDISRTTNVAYNNIKVAKKLAEKFKCDLAELERYCSTKGIKNWGEIATSIMDKRTNRDHSVKEAASTVTGVIKRALEGDMVDREEARKLLAQIVRNVPIKKDIADRMHVKYHRCVCCKAEPPTEGHEYVYSPELGMHIPVCKDCVSNASPIDYKEVAAMYSTYAVNMELAFDKIYLRGNEDDYDV
jgi:hypothetical protein